MSDCRLPVMEQAPSRGHGASPIAELGLELELIQSHMAQKPILRGDVGARALRVR